jgi:glycosyltransferase involved in cell wall biosynthesis
MATPFVTVVTPVYNGERYLAASIESVLNQTYGDWEYVIVDNASTDRTAEIIAAYAARDSRIRVHTNERLVPVVENHNIGFRQMSASAVWCKVVAADDALLPECLEKMLALAAAHPSVGIVGAYQLQGSRVGLGGLPYPSPVMPGHIIGRASLLGILAVFGNPTSHMIRADFVRGREPFYDESMIHADEAACYDVLQTADFAFVHQVLTYQRIHSSSITFSRARWLNTYLLDHMKMTMKYGRAYLSAEELDRVVQERLDAYDRYLVRALLRPARREIWRYHTEGLRALGFAVRYGRLLRALGREVGRGLLPRATQVFGMMKAGEHEDDMYWREWWAPTGFERIKSVAMSPATASSTAASSVEASTSAPVLRPAPPPSSSVSGG